MMREVLLSASSASGSLAGSASHAHSDDDDDDEGFGFAHPGYIAVWYYLAVVYLAIEIYGIHRYFLSTDMYYSFLVQPQKAFYILIILGTFIRILFFVLQPFTIFGLFSISNTLNNCFLLLPNFIFFCAFFILLFLWIEAYYAARESPIHNLRLYFILTIVAMWTIFGGLFICDAIYCRVSSDPTARDNCSKPIAEALTPCEQGIYYFDGIIYFLISLLFTIFGALIFNKMRTMPTLKRRKQVLQKVLVMATVCVVCFIARAIATIYNTKYPSSLQPYWWVDGTYYTLLEALPLTFFLLILRSNENQQQQQIQTDNNRTLETPVLNRLVQFYGSVRNRD